MFERVVYLYFSFCLCYVKEISTDMLEEQVSKERDTELDEEEDIITYDIKEEHGMDVDEDGEDNNKIHALRWEVHKIEK